MIELKPRVIKDGLVLMSIGNLAQSINILKQDFQNNEIDKNKETKNLYNSIKSDSFYGKGILPLWEEGFNREIISQQKLNDKFLNMVKEKTEGISRIYSFNKGTPSVPRYLNSNAKSFQYTKRNNPSFDIVVDFTLPSYVSAESITEACGQIVKDVYNLKALGYNINLFLYAGSTMYYAIPELSLDAKNYSTLFYIHEPMFDILTHTSILSDVSIFRQLFFHFYYTCMKQYEFYDNGYGRAYQILNEKLVSQLHEQFIFYSLPDYFGLDVEGRKEKVKNKGSIGDINFKED